MDKKEIEHCYMVTFATPRHTATMQVITADMGARLYDTIISEIADAGKDLDGTDPNTIVVKMVFDCGVYTPERNAAENGVDDGVG